MKTLLNTERILLLVIFLISGTVSKGHVYKYIGLEDGLNNQKIYHIQKDQRGYMWQSVSYKDAEKAGSIIPDNITGFHRFKCKTDLY